MYDKKIEFVKPLDVLLIEDDSVDVELVLEVLKDSKLLMSINVARDGVEGLAYLRRERDFCYAKKPDLILLDLNMPKKDGRQVLQELKMDDALSKIPVIVLTTSTSEEDMLKSYDLGAHGYINKPACLEQFIKIVKSIDSFWFTIVNLSDSGENRK